MKTKLECLIEVLEGIADVDEDIIEQLKSEELDAYASSYEIKDNIYKVLSDHDMSIEFSHIAEEIVNDYIASLEYMVNIKPNKEIYHILLNNINIDGAIDDIEDEINLLPEFESYFELIGVMSDYKIFKNRDF